MSVQVIAPGFGRTGTTSLTKALEILGFGPAYQMQEILYRRPSHVSLWRDAAAGKPEWKRIFNGYGSITDFPACSFYKEIMLTYPDAKIVLTERDFDSWYNSASNTIYKMQNSFFGIAKYIIRPNLLKMVNETVWDRVFKGKFQDKDFARSIYLEFIEDVKNHVPSDRLLLFSVKEGWEPLCKFLQVEIPSCEFPHLNDNAQFQKSIVLAQIASFFVNIIVFVCFPIFVSILVKMIFFE